MKDNQDNTGNTSNAFAYTSGNGGFARLVVILMFFSFMFIMTGFDLRAFTDKQNFLQHANNIQEFVVEDVHQEYIEPYYKDYVKPTTSFVWNDVIDQVVVGALQANVDRVAHGNGTDFSKSFQKLRSQVQ